MKNNMMLIISKMCCSSSQVVLIVRRRPRVLNGGGFVVTNCNQEVVFRVDSNDGLGRRGELVLRDADGEAVLLICRKGGIAEALSIQKKWQGYCIDYNGSLKWVFSLSEPNSCCRKSPSIRISVKPMEGSTIQQLEVRGNFPDRDCSIVDTKGNTIVQIGIRKELEELMTNKDLYYVEVKPGIDQAFVFGVITMLEYMYA